MRVTIYYRFKDGIVFSHTTTVSSLDDTVRVQKEVCNVMNEFDRIDIYEYETGDVYRVWKDLVEKI